MQWTEHFRLNPTNSPPHVFKGTEFTSLQNSNVNFIIALSGPRSVEIDATHFNDWDFQIK